MASGTGYIYEWIVDDVGGLIHVCSGDRLVGDDIAFPFNGCSEEVQSILNDRDINDEVDCPPPGGALKVRFDFDIVGGLHLAVNVRRN